MAVTTLTNLAVGDQVAIKRNLNHPANMKKAPRDERDVTQRYVADPAMVAQEDLGIGTIIDRRTDFYGKIRIRVSNGFWYDVTDGYQDGAKATLIELI